MLTLDFFQRCSCSHQSFCQCTTRASYCMHHLLCASGFPEALCFFFYVRLGKHKFLAQSTSLESHGTTSWCLWCAIVIRFMSFAFVLWKAVKVQSCACSDAFSDPAPHAFYCTETEIQTGFVHINTVSHYILKNSAYLTKRSQFTISTHCATNASQSIKSNLRDIT